MIDIIGGAFDVHFQRYHLFHLYAHQLRNFEEPGSHLSQQESLNQNSSDVPMKSNRGSINRELEVYNGLVMYSKTGSYYCMVIEEGVPELLEDVPIVFRKRLWFYQDGVPAHNSSVVTNYLDVHFRARWIGDARFMRPQKDFVARISVAAACVRKMPGTFDFVHLSLHRRSQHILLLFDTIFNTFCKFCT